MTLHPFFLRQISPIRMAAMKPTSLILLLLTAGAIAGVGLAACGEEPPADDGEPPEPDASIGESPDAATPVDSGTPSDAGLPARYSFVVMGDSQFATTSCTSGVTERLA